MAGLGGGGPLLRPALVLSRACATASQPATAGNEAHGRPAACVPVPAVHLLRVLCMPGYVPLATRPSPAAGSWCGDRPVLLLQHGLPDALRVRGQGQGREGRGTGESSTTADCTCRDVCMGLHRTSPHVTLNCSPRGFSSSSNAAAFPAPPLPACRRHMLRLCLLLRGRCAPARSTTRPAASPPSAMPHAGC